MATLNRRGGLFINILAINHAAKPIKVHFTKVRVKVDDTIQLAQKNKPIEAIQLFNLKEEDKLYTRFVGELPNSTPVMVDLNNPENYYFTKRYYTYRLKLYFRSLGLIVTTNHITKDCQIWIRDDADNEYPNSEKYDRFTVKVDYDHFNDHPKLVLSYDRPSWACRSSVSQILNSVDDPFSEKQPTTDLFTRVLYMPPDQEASIDRYKFLASKCGFNDDYAFPFLNRDLISFLGLDNNTEDDYFAKPKNKYERYHTKIKAFYEKYLNNEEFRSICDINPDGFSLLNPAQIGQTPSESRLLAFGNGTTNYSTQAGINKGPYLPTPFTHIRLLSIFPEKDMDIARDLLIYFKDNYKNLFNGLKKYIGKPFGFEKKYLAFKSTDTIISELDDFLQNAHLNHDDDTKYIAIYLTPIGKYASDRKARNIYYQVKERLLRYGIESQCIETKKMVKLIEHDNTHTDRYGNPLKNFAYTLQNMAIAINAKLSGIPWCLACPEKNELVVGVGAFRNVETKVQYIGAAFSFNNTGTFNSFECFQKDELSEMAGAIENAIINFTRVNSKPERLIIHYYKQMNRREFEKIERTLHNLDLDIPIYVVTISKTEAEDYFLFEAPTLDYNQLMPMSGTYVNLGHNSYLLCNNTRYETNFNPSDGFPFPVKIKIDCPNNGEQPIDEVTCGQLINQVYQFSRIYWKSIKQQPLPVTIAYAGMIAQIVPHFSTGFFLSYDKNSPWFL